MSLISDGIDDVGFETYGVMEVRRQVETAKKQIDDTDKRMIKAKLPKNLQERWSGFMKQWENFYQSTQGVEGAFNQFKDKTYQRTVNFQNTAEILDKTFLTPEGTLSPAAPTFGQQKPTSQKSDTNIALPSFSPSIGWDIPWMKILLWGGAGVGGYLLVKKLWQHSPQGKAVSFIAAPKEETTEG
jgi:hypothetical protein